MLNLTPIINGDSNPVEEQERLTPANCHPKNLFGIYTQADFIENCKRCKDEMLPSIVKIEIFKTDSINILSIKWNPDLLQKFDEYDLKVFLEKWTGTEINQVEIR